MASEAGEGETGARSEVHGRDVTLFDRIARLYDLKPRVDRSTLRPALERVDRDVDVVVDVGGGTGQGVRAFGPDVHRIVVDAAPGMIRRATRRGLDAVVGDGGRLPIRTRSTDVVLVLDALHHMSAPEPVLSEASRILRSGGLLVVREYDPTTVRGRALAAVEHTVGFASTFYAPGDLETLVRSAGLNASIVSSGFAYEVVGLKPRTGKDKSTR